MTTIKRPEVEFDADTHTYTLGGQPLAGVSTVAHIGNAEDAFGIASAWGFRVGYEGAHDLISRHLPTNPWESKDDLRDELQRAGKTPWSKRDKATARGNWVHDVLEELATSGKVASIDRFEGEVRGHVQSLYGWYVWLRPEMVATEVQIASVEHGFAGRYDLRVLVEAKRLLECLHPLRQDRAAKRIRQLAAEGKRALGLMDLKTSKRVYPTTHFVQLEGYELGGVEMGFPETDFRAVVNTSPEGERAELAISWAEPDDFLAYLQAHRAIRRIKAGDPETIARAARDEALLAALPARARDIAAQDIPALAGMDARGIGRALGYLRKAGRVKQEEGGVWAIA